MLEYITLLNNEYPPLSVGGAGMLVGELSKFLSKSIKTEVRFFGDDQNTNNSNLIVKGYGEKKISDALDLLESSIKMARKEAQLIHNFAYYTSFAAFLIKKHFNVPLISTPPSLEPFRPWKKESLGNDYELTKYIEKLSINNSDHLIAISNAMKKDIIDCYNVDADKISIIHPGIDIAKYKKSSSTKVHQKYNISGDYILFVGRITKQKGIEYLLESINYLPDSVSVVLFLGKPDNEKYYNKIIKQIKCHPKSSNIIVIKNHYTNNRKELIELCSNAKCLVVPSIYEPFGIVNIEAMACETPVIASAVDGITDIIEDEETGFLIEPKNPRLIAEKINELLSNEKIRLRFGKAGRKRVIDVFNWEKIVNQHINLYEKVLSRYSK